MAQVNDLLKAVESPSLNEVVKYMLRFTVIGTGVDKLARYVASGLMVNHPDKDIVKQVEEVLRKNNIKNEIERAIMLSFVNGFCPVYRFKKVRRRLICPDCGQGFDMKDMKTELDTSLFSRTGENAYHAPCMNEKCKSYKKIRQMVLDEKVVNSIDNIRITAWEPDTVSIVKNDITGEKEYFYDIPERTKDRIVNRDHYTMATTPEIFVEAALKQRKLKLVSNFNVVLMSLDENSKGRPVPVLYRAVLDMILHNKFAGANEKIANDSMDTFKSMFPRATQAMGQYAMPVTTNMRDVSVALQNAYTRWRDDKTTDPVFFPFEVVSKDHWGSGKLLLTLGEVKEVLTSAMAAIGIPLEFIYGGVTWSRQNTSTIILEHMFKTVIASINGLLQDLSETFNNIYKNTENVEITIKPPRLVDSLNEVSALMALNQEQKISDSTLLDRGFGISSSKEADKVKKEFDDRKWAKSTMGRLEAEAQRQIALSQIEIEDKASDSRRKSMLKDAMIQSSIEADNILMNIRAAKAQMKMDMQSQKDMMDFQIKRTPVQMVAELLGQYVADKKVTAIQEADEMKQIQETVRASLQEEELKQLEQMSEEEQQQYIMEVFDKMQMEEFRNSLTSDERKAFDLMNEQEQQQYVQEKQKVQQSDEMYDQAAMENPTILNKKLERQYEQSLKDQKINSLAEAYNKMGVLERSQYDAELMNEDAELYAKVKKLADDKFVDSAMQALFSNDQKIVSKVIEMVRKERPDLLDNLYVAMQEHTELRERAFTTAIKLMNAEGTEEFERIVDDLKNNTPISFRQMVVEAYVFSRKYVTAKNEEAKQSLISGRKDLMDTSGYIDEVAEKISVLGLEDKIRMLETLQVENPAFAEKVKARMGGNGI